MCDLDAEACKPKGLSKSYHKKKGFDLGNKLGNRTLYYMEYIMRNNIETPSPQATLNLEGFIKRIARKKGQVVEKLEIRECGY